MSHETLYLAVKLVDHYLMKEICKKDKLQLLGSTAFLIAAKFEVSPNPRDLEKINQFLSKPYMYVCTFTYVCIYVCACVYILYTCIPHVCMCIHLHICISVCVYNYIHEHN